MNRHLQHLLLVTIIGTTNILIFLIMSHHTVLFLRRSPTVTTFKMSNSYSSSLDVPEDERYGFEQLVVEKLLGHDVHRQPLINESENHSSFRSQTNDLSSNLTLYQDETDVTAKQVVQDGTDDSDPAQSLANNVLTLYNGKDSMHINPHSYKLILDEPLACFDTSGLPKDVFLLILITTIHKNFEQRRAIRQTWGSPQEVAGKKVITMFLLAENNDAALQRQVEEESIKHHDLLQEDFKDTYKNLTLKTIMGMKWAYSHCPHASYVMKTDDDMYVSYANLIKHLTSDKMPSTNYAAGFSISSKPNRIVGSKWYVPKTMYPKSRYPPVVSGTGYVLSGDLTGKIYKKSLDIKYFYLEDVFVAICLRALNVTPVSNKHFHNWHIRYSYCRFLKLITTHMVKPSEMHRIWNDQQRMHFQWCALFS